MSKQVNASPKTLISKRRTIVVIFVALTLAVALLIVVQLNSPKRSVAAYCAVYREEGAKLVNAQGDTYGVAVFKHKSSNPDDFTTAFRKLEQVAPDDIRQDVKTLRQLFAELSSDPSQALSVSLSGIAAETSVKKWTDDHCQ